MDSTTSPGTTLFQLDQLSISKLPTMTSRKTQALETLGITTWLDLLTYYPRRYLDRSEQKTIQSIEIGAQATVLARVKSSSVRRTRSGKTLVEVEVFDSTASMKCSFFNQAWRAKQLSAGKEAILFGKLDSFRGKRQMVNPVVDFIGDKTGRIIPLYPQSEKASVSTWEIDKLIKILLDEIGPIQDPLLPVQRQNFNFESRTWSFQQIHNPSSFGVIEKARKRLAFDELLRLQFVLVSQKKQMQAQVKGIRHKVGTGPNYGELIEAFLSALSYEMTNAQKKAVEEIFQDMTQPFPMHRLLQGDVGSGKTVVAICTLLAAIQSGYQGAFMAPTEVLAEQHYLSLKSMLSQIQVKGKEPVELSLFDPVVPSLEIGLFVAKNTASKKSQLITDLASGKIDIAIGTHALLSPEVKFNQLGVVVVDEQHRFGVEQRAMLRQKGQDVDVLVMTATPIPRTAAMTQYGDLDVSVLDELPTGRRPIKTIWGSTKDFERRVWDKLIEQVNQDKQAYVVCPLIEDSEKIQARSAVETYEILANGVLSKLKLALLHGQMTAKEKEQVMADFRDKKIDVLIATTVIEVGVDVPNATVMVIQDADRFGIAQLHQLRGRVGRGKDDSWCFLLAEASTEDSKARLEALASTTDGFLLAEKDLEIRGEGSILGTRQKGITDLKLASLKKDLDLIVQARELASEIIDHKIQPCSDILSKEVALLLEEQDAQFLFKN